MAGESGLALSEVVLSNGVFIKPQQAQWLKAEGVKLMISLDGVGEVHDRQRPDVHGNPTFAAVEHTVDQVLLPLGIQPDISITVTALNADGIADAAYGGRWNGNYRSASISSAKTPLVPPNRTSI